jgi:hypothetical protein
LKRPVTEEDGANRISVELKMLMPVGKRLGGSSGIAYLNGLQTPQIEQVDLPGDKLGISFRSVFDYGVVPSRHH